MPAFILDIIEVLCKEANIGMFYREANIAVFCREDNIGMFYREANIAVFCREDNLLMPCREANITLFNSVFIGNKSRFWNNFR